ncbi:hypothetical protein tb265_14100 [Gemmatimonadetes bacterium T265]|nr:hypothetical protein tb265_14100 [Gemmatimonadetes bacterium T265]
MAWFHTARSYHPPAGASSPASEIVLRGAPGAGAPPALYGPRGDVVGAEWHVIDCSCVGSVTAVTGVRSVRRVRPPTLLPVSTTSGGARETAGYGPAPRRRGRARALPLAVRGVAVLGVASAACGRDEPRPSAQNVAPASVAANAPAGGHEHTWDDAAGLGLVVRVGSGAEMLVTPDVAEAQSGTVRSAASAPGGGVVLFGRAGMLGHARADSAAGGAPLAGGCATWSAVRLGPASGADAMPAWSVGFVVPPGSAQPSALPLDSLDVLSSRDSAALAAAVTRLAASLPDTGRGSARRPALRGVPFRVRDAHRFTLADGSGAVAAVLTRTVNTEAAPFAEQIFLVGEHRAGRPWQLTYAESVAGAEESLPATDVLAAVQLPAGAASALPNGPARPARAALVLGREGDDGSRYTLLEREAPGRWRARWTSAVCGAGAAGAARAS